MMVVHVDPDNNSVYMVSIPRDSWVYVPANGAMHKIDQAFSLELPSTITLMMEFDLPGRLLSRIMALRLTAMPGWD